MDYDGKVVVQGLDGYVVAGNTASFLSAHEKKQRIKEFGK